MKLFISDASSLILSEKVRLLELLIKRYEIIIPEEVYKEVIVKGKKKNAGDAHTLYFKLQEKKIRVIKVKNEAKVKKLMYDFSIQQGETEAIVLFLEQKAECVLLDDRKAITACKVYGIPFLTTLALVLLVLKQKLTNKTKAKNMIKDLAIYGRYKDELVFKALDEVEKNE